MSRKSAKTTPRLIVDRIDKVESRAMITDVVSYITDVVGQKRQFCCLIFFKPQALLFLTCLQHVSQDRREHRDV
jgi:hypothetical protein